MDDAAHAENQLLAGELTLLDGLFRSAPTPVGQPDRVAEEVRTRPVCGSPPAAASPDMMRDQHREVECTRRWW